MFLAIGINAARGKQSDREPRIYTSVVLKLGNELSEPTDEHFWAYEDNFF